MGGRSQMKPLFSIPANQKPFIYLTGAILVWIAIFLVMVWIAPMIPNPGETSPIFWSTSYLAFLSCIVLTGTLLYLIFTWVQLDLSVGFLFGMTLIYACLIHYGNKYLNPDSWTFAIWIDIGLLGIGCHLGKIIALGVNQRSYLVPLSLVASVMDLWSVWGGPTRIIVENQHYQNYFLILYPLLGTHLILPTLGLGDITFLAIYIGVIGKFNLRERATSWAIIFAFIITYLLSILSGKGLPAIPFISAAFLSVNWKQLEFKKEDVRTTFIFIAVFFVILYLAMLLGK